MKRLLFSIILSFVLNGFCEAQEGFHIFGRLGGVQGGKLLLIAHDAKGFTQLDAAEMVNGDFEFAGSVTEPVVAYVTTDKQQLVSIIMLDNAEYTLTAGEVGIEVVGGGDRQKIWNQFDRVSKRIMKEKMLAEQEAKAAYVQQNQARAVQANEQFQKILQKAQEERMGLIKTYKNSDVSAYVIISLIEQIPPEQLSLWYEILDESVKTSFFGSAIKRMVDRYQQVAVGSIAPNFKAPLIEGGYITLHEVKAKVKLIDFWASWCAPCRMENKNLPKLYRKYQKEGLEIISFSLDNKELSWLKAVREDNMTWKNVSDLKGWGSDIAKLYFVKSIPHTLLLDEENRIVAKNLRGSALQKKIAEMLGKK